MANTSWWANIIAPPKVPVVPIANTVINPVPVFPTPLPPVIPVPDPTPVPVINPVIIAPELIPPPPVVVPEPKSVWPQVTPLKPKTDIDDAIIFHDELDEATPTTTVGWLTNLFMLKKK